MELFILFWENFGSYLKDALFAIRGENWCRGIQIPNFNSGLIFPCRRTLWLRTKFRGLAFGHSQTGSLAIRSFPPDRSMCYSLPSCCPADDSTQAICLRIQSTPLKIFRAVRVNLDSLAYVDLCSKVTCISNRDTVRPEILYSDRPWLAFVV